MNRYHLMIAIFILTVPLMGKQDMKFTVGLETEYNDNIYKLTDAQIDKYNEKSSKDLTSGRFNNQDSLSDTIFTPKLKFQYRFKTPFSKKITFKSGVQFNIFKENSEKNYFGGEIGFFTKIGKRGRLSLTSEFVNNFYRRNYLTGIDNGGFNDDVSRDERIYGSAYYDEYETVLTYGYKLISSKKRDFTLNVLAGNRLRRYNDLFSNRDRNVWFAGTGIDVNLNKIIDFSLCYRYEKQFTSDYDELILVDETINHVDLTGDGQISDNGALLTAIDRSRDHHILKLNLAVFVTKKWSIFFKGKIRKLYYTTDNTLDSERYNQDQLRKYFSTGISGKIGSVGLRAGYDRIEDESDEGDYTINRGSLQVKYTF